MSPLLPTPSHLLLRFSKSPVKIFLRIFVIEMCTKFSLGVEQELEMYTGFDQGGTGLLIRDKTPNLLEISPIIVSNVQSFCILGRWRIFPKPDFGYDNIGDILAFSTKTFKCHNSALKNVTGSARFLGGSDTEAPSITFYSDENQLGSEVVVEAEELAELPFSPKSLITMGDSSWTIWTEKNFNGEPTCYKSTKRVTVLNSMVATIGSVRQNCSSTLTSIIILDDAKSSIMELIENANKMRTISG